MVVPCLPDRNWFPFQGDPLQMPEVDVQRWTLQRSAPTLASNLKTLQISFCSEQGEIKRGPTKWVCTQIGKASGHHVKRSSLNSVGNHTHQFILCTLFRHGDSLRCSNVPHDLDFFEFCFLQAHVCSFAESWCIDLARLLCVRRVECVKS